MLKRIWEGIGYLAIKMSLILSLFLAVNGLIYLYDMIVDRWSFKDIIIIIISFISMDYFARIFISDVIKNNNKTK